MGQATTPTSASTSPRAGTARPCTRRGLCQGLAPLLAGTPLLLAACGQRGAEDAASQAVALPKGPVTIEFWHRWSGPQYEGPQGMIARIGDAFTAKYPQITVSAQNAGGDYLTKLLATIAGGTPPDVVIIINDTGALYSLAHQGAITPLQDVVSGELGQVKSWVHPNVWDLGVYQGKMWALPLWTQSYHGMMWHTNHFREIGLDPTRLPARTLEELPELGQRLSKQEGGAYTRVGFWDTWFPGVPQLALMRYIPAIGGQLMDAQGQKVTADHPNNIRALEWIVNTLQRLDVARVQAFQATFGTLAEGPFLAGRYSLWPEGPWRLRTIQINNLRREDYGVGTIPPPAGMTGGADFHAGDIPAVPRGAKQVAAAWRFVRFLTGFDGEETYADLLMIQPQIPISQKFTQGTAFKRVLDQYPGYEVWLNHFFGAQRMLTPPKIPSSAAYISTLARFVGQAFKGELSPRDALQQASAEAQRELDAARSQ